MEGSSGQAKAGGQLIPDITGEDLWKIETGDLLQKGLKMVDTGSCELCAYNEVHKTYSNISLYCHCFTNYFVIATPSSWRKPVVPAVSLIICH